jgi:hypothetical protein
MRAPAAVNVGELEAEPDRLGKVGDGAVVIALVLVRDSPIVVGDGGISRSCARGLDDARAAGYDAVRIVPLTSVPVGSARGHGRSRDREQRGCPDNYCR